jgi:galactokinase/mevalonate kinase-like predicted kinase
MMLFFTGFSRTAAMFAKKQIENLDKRETQLRIFHQMVSEAASILQSARQSIKDVGNCSSMRGN